MTRSWALRTGCVGPDGRAGGRQFKRARDLGRFLTFVDAAWPSPLTLLVLPLVELTVELREDDSVANLLRNHGWQFFAFGLGFVVIARMWLGHHEVRRPVIASSHGVVQFSFLWLACVPSCRSRQRWSRPSVTRR
jgi:uncharacterized membrane protein